MTKPRFGASVDGPQPAIVDALGAAGAETLVLDVSEEGAADLLVGRLGVLYLLEVKARDGRLSEAQVKWAERWARAGVKVPVVRSERQALEACNVSPAADLERRRAMRELAGSLDPVGRARGALRPSVRRYGR